jgi:DNA-binding MarR family transcriptional regulator
MDSFRLVTLIRQLHLTIRAELLEHVHAAGYDDISAPHLYIFQSPGPDGLRPTELAQRTLMTKQAVNHLLSGLQTGGYLTRVEAKGDGRARVLRLTTKGRHLTKVMQKGSAEIERRWSTQLGALRMRDLMAALEALAGSADPGRTLEGEDADDRRRRASAAVGSARPQRGPSASR